MNLNMVAFGGAGDGAGHRARRFAPRPADGMTCRYRAAEEIEIVAVAGAANIELETVLVRQQIVRRPALDRFARAIRQVDRAGSGPLASQAIESSPGALREGDLTVAGPLGRSAEDLDLLLGITAGPDWSLSSGWRIDLPAPRARSPKELRVAVWIDDPFCEIDAESAALMKNAAKALEDAGAHVDWHARPDFTLAESTEIYLVLLHSCIGAGFPQSLRDRFMEAKKKLAPGDKSHAALQMIGGTISYADRMIWEERQAQLRAKWADFFKGYDVVLAPVLMRPAFPHDHRSNWHQRTLTVNGKEREYMDVLIWAGPAVVSYLPGTSAPVGVTKEGLPVGIQIIGPHMGDRTTIAVAGMLEEILGGFKAPPGY